MNTDTQCGLLVVYLDFAAIASMILTHSRFPDVEFPHAEIGEAMIVDLRDQTLEFMAAKAGELFARHKYRMDRKQGQ